jgi:hypothetical protein
MTCRISSDTHRYVSGSQLYAYDYPDMTFGNRDMGLPSFRVLLCHTFSSEDNRLILERSLVLN